ncbi:hypothetical protein FC56_GL000921 [Lentilactobacillus senioris DSM 24302 = JCM 17472]|uniref:N-acetyltransferase domain-containing protein n=1 Tax=Lentilactobacillus senioris DSM 24302 = JCM 17472 TaxID=1423802 RepID=A0A0R2CNV8_9LACO|nr:hypothetical protein [Lentilactobacillus senioris]KRM93256.1 hypothetical protein FC56_GL000921 [Lentilactobacillus senioris DSM 24302 = JCM 17472]
MSSFEQLHPVLTPHFKLDWLTKFPVKEIIHEFSLSPTAQTNIQIPQQPLEVVAFVNHTMRQVMAQRELTWGFSTLAAPTFLGFISIQNPHEEVTNISFWYTDISTAAFSEVFNRTVTFITDHFESKIIQVQLNTVNSELSTLFTQAGFTTVNELTWQLKLT